MRELVHAIRMQGENGNGYHGPMPTDRPEAEEPSEPSGTSGTPEPSPSCSSGAAPDGGGRASRASSKRIPTDDIEAVFDAHDAGLRALATVMDRPFRAHGRTQAKRRKAVSQAIQAVGLAVARLAARNLPFSPHHRGENDRKTAYLDIEYAMRRPETYADLFDGPDDDLVDALRVSLQPSEPERAGYLPPGGVTRGEVIWD